MASRPVTGAHYQGLSQAQHEAQPGDESVPKHPLSPKRRKQGHTDELVGVEVLVPVSYIPQHEQYGYDPKGFMLGKVKGKDKSHKDALVVKCQKDPRTFWFYRTLIEKWMRQHPVPGQSLPQSMTHQQTTSSKAPPARPPQPHELAPAGAVDEPAMTEAPTAVHGATDMAPHAATPATGGKAVGASGLPLPSQSGLQRMVAADSAVSSLRAGGAADTTPEPRAPTLGAGSAEEGARKSVRLQAKRAATPVGEEVLALRGLSKRARLQNQQQEQAARQAAAQEPGAMPGTQPGPAGPLTVLPVTPELQQEQRAVMLQTAQTRSANLMQSIRLPLPADVVLQPAPHLLLMTSPTAPTATASELMGDAAVQSALTSYGLQLGPDVQPAAMGSWLLLPLSGDGIGANTGDVRAAAPTPQPTVSQTTGATVSEAARGSPRPSGSKRYTSRTVVADVLDKVLDIPAAIFHVDVPDMYYRARVMGPDKSHGNAVVVKMQEDRRRYYFPVDLVRKWLADTEARRQALGEDRTVGDKADEYAAEVLANLSEISESYHTAQAPPLLPQPGGDDDVTSPHPADLPGGGPPRKRLDAAILAAEEYSHLPPATAATLAEAEHELHIPLPELHQRPAGCAALEAMAKLAEAAALDPDADPLEEVMLVERSSQHGRAQLRTRYDEPLPSHLDPYTAPHPILDLIQSKLDAKYDVPDAPRPEDADMAGDEGNADATAAGTTDIGALDADIDEGPMGMQVLGAEKARSTSSPAPVTDAATRADTVMDNDAVSDPQQAQQVGHVITTASKAMRQTDLAPASPADMAGATARPPAVMADAIARSADAPQPTSRFVAGIGDDQGASDSEGVADIDEADVNLDPEGFISKIADVAEQCVRGSSS